MPEEKEKSKVKKPICDLLNIADNQFSVIEEVKRVMSKNNLQPKLNEFVKRALRANNYDEVLKIAGDYVELANE